MPCLSPPPPRAHVIHLYVSLLWSIMRVLRKEGRKTKLSFKQKSRPIPSVSARIGSHFAMEPDLVKRPSEWPRMDDS
jgi:hypothetical protein